MVFDAITQTIAIRLLVAAVLAGIIGFERQIKREPAGLRTHMLVCMGSALFTMASLYGFNSDPARVAAGIVTGIGFLGAGAIIASKGHIKGITTAASIWVSAALGLTVGIGFYTIAVVTTILVFIILELWRIEYKAGLKTENR